MNSFFWSSLRAGVTSPILLVQHSKCLFGQRRIIMCFQKEHLECYTSNIGGVTTAHSLKYFEQRPTTRCSNNLFAARFFVTRFQNVARWRKKVL